MIRRSFAALCSSLLLVSAALAAPATPPSAFYLHGDESIASPDGPASLMWNTAAAGTRYPSDFSLTFVDLPRGNDLYRGALSMHGLFASISGEHDAALTPSLGAASGSDHLRMGTLWTWLPREGGRRSRDLRIDALSRPQPWLSIGAVAEHIGGSKIEGGTLESEYSLGLALRPLAFSGATAHSWGTRVTLTGDARLPHEGKLNGLEYRVGGEIEAAPGLVLRGSYAFEDKHYQLGVSLLDARSSYHLNSLHDQGGGIRYNAHTISFHQGEDRSVFSNGRQRRIAVVRVSGDLGDDALSGIELLQPVSTTPVAPIHQQLDRALADPLTRGVLLDVRGVSNSAAIEELRPRVERLRRAGKPVVAYLESGGRRAGLYLASACDRIVTSPEAFYPGLGLRSEHRYYRQLLADWGVRIDRTSYGKYKSAYRGYTVDSMPAPDRESSERMLDVGQELFVSTVCADRHMERDRLLTLLDGRLWSSYELQKAGLVDSVGYREDAVALAGSLAGLGKRPHLVRLDKHPEARREWTLPSPIAVVYASGAIDVGRSGSDLLMGPFMGSETISRQLESAFRRRDVKAVVLRVDSPGGSSLASDLMDHTFQRLKRETRKPAVVSMGRYAASGGYDISSHADRIFADRFTVTGSIGVLSIKPSFEGWYAKHNVHEDALERGAYMRGWSEAHDWDAAMQAAADSAVYDEYRRFVASVAEGRKLSWEAVDQIAQGRVWMGEDALDRKLVDQIGGLDEAIADAKQRAGVPAEEKIRLVEYRRPRGSILQRIVGSQISELWARNVHLPEPGSLLFWMDHDETP